MIARLTIGLLLYCALPSSLAQTADANTEVVRTIEVVDDEGTVIALDQAASRIVSLAPSLTEIIFAAGAGDKLVGVVEFSDYPTAATRLPIVGRHDLLDLEAILALAPDLIIAWQSGNPRASVNRLRELGFAVYVAEPKDLGSIGSHLDKIGLLAGTSTAAGLASTDYRRTLLELNNTYSQRRPVKTFYQVWDQPLITAGGNELINDIINLCGGHNVFADVTMVAPKVSVEAVLASDPHVIVASGMDQERPEWLDQWRNWPAVTAVANDKLFFIPPDLLQRHTPRALQGAQQLCERIDSARNLP